MRWQRKCEDKEKILNPKQGEKKDGKKSKQSLRDLWDNVQHFNIHVMQVPDRQEREKGTEKNI